MRAGGMLENMVQGNLFITPKHICFYSTFWGTERKVLPNFSMKGEPDSSLSLNAACSLCRAGSQEVIPLDDVQAIEKKNTARIIPNALEISVGRGEKEVKVK